MIIEWVFWVFLDFFCKKYCSKRKAFCRKVAKLKSLVRARVCKKTTAVVVVPPWL